MEEIKNQKHGEGDVVTVENTTTFIEEEEVQVEHDYRYAVPNTSSETLAVTYDQQSIKDFLAKPYILQLGTFSSNQVRNDQIFGSNQLRTSKMFVANGGTPPTDTFYYDKIKGYKYIRYTARLRLQTNAQPFQAGMLLLYVVPLDDPKGAGNNTSWDKLHLLNIAQKYQLPCVELDIRDGVCELVVPYVAPVSALDIRPNLTIDFYSGSRIYVSVVSPLTAGEPGAVDLTLWVSFEDVELYGPVHPQSGGNATKSSRKNLNVVSSGNRPMSRISPAEIEKRKAQGPGSVEVVSREVSKLASTVAHSIPMLAAVAMPISWLANAAAGVASFFGFSKPINDAGAQYLINRPSHSMASGYGLNYGENLGLMLDNAISPSATFSGCAADEMSFAFLSSIRTPSHAFQWAVATPRLSVLHSHAVSLDQTAWNTNGLTLSYCPMFTIAKSFKLVKGSVKCRLKFIKTQYHSGRLEVIFIPHRGTDPILLPNFNNTPYVLREIIDIQLANEITLILPFISGTEFMVNDQAWGTIAIRVINELRAPTTVAQSIDIIAYFSPGDDFMVSQMIGSDSLGNSTQVIPQMGEEMANRPIGNAVITSNGVDSAGHTSGEVCFSVKTMLLRSVRCYDTTADKAVFDPFTVSMPIMDLTNLNIIKILGAPYYDAHSAIVSGYALRRGSVRIYLDSASPRRAGLVQFAGAVPNDSSLSVNANYLTTVGLNKPGGYSGPCVPFSSYANIVIPQTSPCLSVLNQVVTPKTPSFVDTSDSGMRLAFDVALPLDDCWRSYGDDFQLGCFVGFAPFAIGVVTASVV